MSFDRSQPPFARLTSPCRPEAPVVSLVFLSPLHRATRQIALHSEKALRGTGLSPIEGHLLAFLRGYAPVSVGELLRVFGMKRSTLTSILDRLEERGLLVRETDGADRRSFLVSLTRGGLSEVGRVEEWAKGLESAIRSRTTAKDVEGFRRVLEAIASATGVEVRHDRAGPKSSTPSSHSAATQKGTLP